MSDSWNGRKVLVTGATGMVGSSLVNALLARGADIVALVRDADPRSELYRSGDTLRVAVVTGSLEDFWTVTRAINEQQVDTVFHLGAQAIVGAAHTVPLLTFEANIRGTYNVLEACRLTEASVQRIVVASSDKAYGAGTQLPYTEDMPLTGRHPYEVSKSCADLIAQAYYHTYRLPVVIARCGNIYGAGDLNWSRLVPGTIRALLAGERPVIRSDGTYRRDYIYVKDAVCAYMRLAESLNEDGVSGEAFNFSTETPMTVLEMVGAIQQVMGCTAIQPDIQNSTQAEIRDQHLSAQKARTVLKWMPSFDVAAGLAETVAWYRRFLTRS